MSDQTLRPVTAPLYDARHEHDACGVGFVAAPGRPSTKLVDQALEALAALAHRGARAADARTGDGAGILLPLPAPFVTRVASEAGASGIDARRIAIGMLFLPDGDGGAAAEAMLGEELHRVGLTVAGWRSVPVAGAVLAGRALSGAPAIRQVVVMRPPGMRRLSFGRLLLLARRRFEVWAAATPGLSEAAVVSLSDSSIVYKGLFIGAELGQFYDDLRADDLTVAYAVFHQRYSTNTFPSWRLAQPFRYLAHNGEINTVRPNRELMNARRNELGGGPWAQELVAAGPLLSPDASDSLSLDEAAELIVMGGRRIDAALLELIPPAEALAAPYRGASGAIEPWDGPAAIVMADGVRVAALLDRNGLRPAAYTIDRDGLVVVASEAGCVDVPAGRVVRHGRLGPGELLMVDTALGTVLGDRDAKEDARRSAGFDPRLRVVATDSVTDARPGVTPALDPRQRFAFGLDAEVVRLVVRPMASGGREAVYSMGDDTPIAPLARHTRRPSAYLRQSFAQVTNPAIDPERERAVMSLEVEIGPRPPLLARRHRHEPRIVVDSPVLDFEDWLRLTDERAPWRVARFDATWAVREEASGLEAALDRLAHESLRAVRGGARLIALSDRRAGSRRAGVPSVLAAGAVHQALARSGCRPRADIVIEGGDLFDVHDVAMTLACGASAVHPYLLLELSAEVAGSRGAEELSAEAARDNLAGALDHGLRKVLARMGVSQISSYCGGQLFEAVGIATGLATRCFPAAGLHPGSTGARELAADILERHTRAYAATTPSLGDPGRIRFRGSGEYHAFSPRVAKVIQAVADAPADEMSAALVAYREAIARDEPALPRDLLTVAPAPPASIDAVEPASAIVRRFVSSAMSLGALSPEAHQALAIGMARLGGSANTGEGGEDPAWYKPLPNGDRRESAIKQVASARFGVTAEYLARAEQLEIKIAQGSKPGEGGQLPGKKVTAFIAALRRGQPGMTMISPPPHHDIYSIEDLAQLITDLRAINPAARVGVKLVASAGIGTIAAGVAKAHADYIMVSGHAGGTGASPLSSIKSVGISWELGLAEVHQVLVRNRLRDQVVLRVDGGLQSGSDVVIAALLGAEEYGFGTSALVALGCDMARQCHLDTCPTGIATQREELRAKFTGTPEAIVSYFTAIAEDVRRELANIGLTRLGDAVGRIDLLRPADPTVRALDLAALLAAPAWSAPPDRRTRAPKDLPRRDDRPVASDTEQRLVELFRGGSCPEHISARLTTRDRAFGAALSGELERGGRHRSRSGAEITLSLEGCAGQSLGAFLAAGLRLELQGLANDYVGKGLSGGTLVVRPPDDARFEAGEAAIAGNTCLYGATGGRLHLVGRAGMRFAVRNSGATAVVEGAGAHACEYMTGGVVVVLGSTGANLGAGMTGGRAYLFDVDGRATERLNRESVTWRRLHDGPLEDELRSLIRAHAAEGSARAAGILQRWGDELAHFLVVEPRRGEAGASTHVPLVVAEPAPSAAVSSG